MPSRCQLTVLLQHAGNIGFNSTRTKNQYR